MSLLSRFDSENYTIPLDFTSLAPQSRLFANASSELMNILATQPVTMNNHMYGICMGCFHLSLSLSVQLY